MARLVVKSGSDRGHEFPLAETQSIGRLARNEIAIDDTRMSRSNTRVYRLGKRWMVEDLKSKNGTFLNGKTILKSVLNDNDEIRVGETHFSFIAEAQLDNFGNEEISLELGDVDAKKMGISRWWC